MQASSQLLGTTRACAGAPRLNSSVAPCAGRPARCTAHAAAAPPARRARAASAAAAGGPAPAPGFGVFVCSGSAAIAEALAVSGLDWICVDAQHGAVSYTSLHDILAATSGAPCKRIVRVGGPDDRYGMQQALE